MVKDPLDNGRTSEIPFEPLTEAVKQSIPEIQPGAEVTINGDVYKVEGPEFKSTLTPEEIEAAEKEIRGRSFSGRHPELGKMFKCQVHGFRHRKFEFGLKCEQKFTNRIGDYELLREEVDEKTGEKKLVPAYRTATQPDSQPTRNQIAGAPRRVEFRSPRYNPHPSKVKLLLIEYVRTIFQGWEDTLNRNLDRMTDETAKEKIVETFQAEAQKYLQRARIEAARLIRKRRELSDREIRRRQDQSRRINRGLQVKVRA